MPQKFWIQYFETGIDRLRVAFFTEDGEVTSIQIVQYEAFIDGRWHPIVRFDEVHGYFHRDILSPDGVQEKITRSASDKGIALNESIDEIKRHWQTYRQKFEEVYDASK